MKDAIKQIVIIVVGGVSLFVALAGVAFLVLHYSNINLCN